MASITSSLFGTLAGMGSPETLLEQRVQQAYGGNRRPGDVFFNASAGAGEQLMQSTRKLFGQEDEQTRQQRKLQAIIQGVQAQTDVSTPEGLTTLADQLNMFPEFSGIALAMRQEAAKLKMDVTKNEIGNALKQAQIQTEGFQQTKLAADAEKALREPTAKENMLKPSQEFASTGLSLGITPKPNLADYTPEDSAKIQAQIQKNKESTARAGIPASGEVRIPDLAGAQTLVNNLVKAPLDKLNTVKDIRSQLNLAKKGTGAALPQLQRLLAKLVGDSQISQSETVQALGSAGIVGNTISSVNQFMTGLPTQDKLNSVEQVVDALEDINAQSFNGKRNQAAAVLAEARLPESTRKALLPPEYKTGKQKKTQFVEGKIYKDAKGNRARYVDGKWEPVQ